MIKFERVHRLLNNVQKLDDTRAWIFAIDNRETKLEIIQLNTEDQLYEHGIDKNEVSLGEYSLFTIAEKISKGERYDHVTLKDRGTFYDSFQVRVHAKGFDVIADDIAYYDRPLTEVYGLDILGLTEENALFLGDFITDKYQEYVRQTLLS